MNRFIIKKGEDTPIPFVNYDSSGAEVPVSTFEAVLVSFRSERSGQEVKFAYPGRSGYNTMTIVGNEYNIYLSKEMIADFREGAYNLEFTYIFPVGSEFPDNDMDVKTNVGLFYLDNEHSTKTRSSCGEITYTDCKILKPELTGIVEGGINVEINLGEFTVNNGGGGGTNTEVITPTSILEFDKIYTQQVDATTIGAKIFSLGSASKVAGGGQKIKLGYQVTSTNIETLLSSLLDSVDGSFNPSLSSGETNLIWIYWDGEQYNLVYNQGTEYVVPLPPLDAPVMNDLIVLGANSLNTSIVANVVGNDGYRYRYSDDEASWTTVDVAQDDTSEDITGLLPATLQYVQWQTKGDGVTTSDSAWTASKTATTDSLPLLAATTLGIPVMGGNTANLSIQTIANNQGYGMYYKLQSSGTWLLHGNASQNATDYTCTGLVGVSAYDFMAITLADNVNYADSLPSSVVQGTTEIGLPSGAWTILESDDYNDTTKIITDTSSNGNDSEILKGAGFSEILSGSMANGIKAVQILKDSALQIPRTNYPSTGFSTCAVFEYTSDNASFGFVNNSNRNNFGHVSTYASWGDSLGTASTVNDLSTHSAIIEGNIIAWIRVVDGSSLRSILINLSSGSIIADVSNTITYSEQTADFAIGGVSTSLGGLSTVNTGELKLQHLSMWKSIFNSSDINNASSYLYNKYGY